MSSIFSDIEVNNMSLLTYGAIGITSIVLAVVTIFDKEGGPEMASVVEPEVSPIESSDAGLFSNNEKPEEVESSSMLPEVFSNNAAQEEGSQGSQEGVSEQNVSEQNVSEQNVTEEPNPVSSETQETEVPASETEGQEEKKEVLLGGKKRKSNTKKNGKSRGKKQRKTRSK
jgi:hypothetical protein